MNRAGAGVVEAVAPGELKLAAGNFSFALGFRGRAATIFPIRAEGNRNLSAFLLETQLKNAVAVEIFIRPFPGKIIAATSA